MKKIIQMTSVVRSLCLQLTLFCLVFLCLVSSDLYSQSVLACNSHSQISAGGDCLTFVTPDMVLEGNYPDFSIFEVQLWDGVTQVSNPIVSDYLNVPLSIKVIDSTDDNFCWGEIIVEDKLGPSIDCSTSLVLLTCNDEINTVPSPIATDNCDGIVPITLIDEEVTDLGCNDPSGLLRRIVRTYTAFDSNNNEADEACVQTIEIQRADLINVVLPIDYSEECSGQGQNLNPENTGYPTLNGVSLADNSICNLVTTFTDDTLQSCDNTLKIIRNWQVVDWCNNSSTPTGVLVHEQLVAIEDNTPPVVSCDSPMTISVNQGDCTAGLLLPMPEILDFCSGDVQVEVFSNLGHFTDIENTFVDGLEIGFNGFNYIATDACGNMSSCFLMIIVEDMTPPVMVCDEITNVALDNEGLAIVYAESISDGSYDSCTDLDFTIRRLDQDLDYASSIEFSCIDQNTTVMVQVRAEDNEGNTNFCMVEIEVEENLIPLITCPSDVVIDCTQDPTLTFGFPVLDEACAITSATFEDISNTINNCGTGQIIRRYQVTDVSGNTATCDQTITIVNPEELTVEDIDWPLDYDSAVCGTTVSSLEADSLPAPHNIPVIDRPDCSQVAVSMTDEFFDLNPPACLRIARTWTVIDWCIYDPQNPQNGGIFTHTQQITVTDSEAPFLVCPPNPFVKIINPVCDTTIFLFGPDTLMDCNPNVFLTATSDLGEGLGPFENVEPGDYNVTLIASDGCGNTSYCDYILQVDDNKPPVPYCEDTLIITLMDTGMIPFNVGDFNVGSFDNCTAPEDLLISYSPNPNDTVRIFTCADVGANEIEMYVTDEDFNTDFCQVTLVIQDNMFACGAPLTVGGSVGTSLDAGMENVILQTNLDASTATSDVEGMYELIVDPGDDVTIVPSYEGLAEEGVTTIDIVWLRRHILNIETIVNPYAYIAADVNNSGTLTTSDIIAIKRVILNLTDAFPNNTNWRFVDRDYQFENSSNPLLEPFPEIISINNISEDYSEANFVAIKVGDINQSLGLVGNGFDSRNNYDFDLEANDLYLDIGDTSILNIVGDNADQIIGLQGLLQLDTNFLRIEQVLLNEVVTDTDLGLDQITKGQIRVSWENVNAQSNFYFDIKVTALKPCKISDILNLNFDLMNNEYYPATNVGDSEVLELTFNKMEVNQLTLFAPYPNPFKEQTSIVFASKNETPYALEIFDLNGKLVHSITTHSVKGMNIIDISNSNLGDNGGIFIYKISTRQDQVSGRIINL